MSKMQIVYADHAATTPMLPEVFAAMEPYIKNNYGNPSSAYSLGRTAKAGLEDARRQTARLLNAEASEIYFCAGGTQSCNLALVGAALSQKEQGKQHIITSQIEHHAVLNTVDFLKKSRFTLDFLPVNANGFTSPENLERLLSENTGVVSLMYANNELGSIQPVIEAAEVCHRKNIIFHSDAVQAAGHIPVDVKADGMDMLSLSAHKFNGPKGIAAIYIKSGTGIKPLIHGGGQERGMIAGTENVAGAVGLAAALTAARRDLESEAVRISALRQELTSLLLNIPDSFMNGSQENSLPGILNIRFDGIEAETLLIMLDMAGICISAGSACSSGASTGPSHVLQAIGLNDKQAKSSIRISLGRHSSREDIARIAKTISDTVQLLRGAEL